MIVTDWTVTCSEQLALGWYLVSCTRWCRDLGTRLKVEPTEENSYCGSFFSFWAVTDVPDVLWPTPPPHGERQGQAAWNLGCCCLRQPHAGK